MKRKVVQAGSLFGAAVAALTSAAASICCIGPLAITLLGVNGAILAAGVKPYRGYFLGASLVFLGIGFWGVYGQRKAQACEACSVRSGRVAKAVVWSASALWVGALAIQFLADRFWL